MGAPPLRWRALLACLAATTAVTACTWLLVPPTYLTNDDVTIRLDLEAALVPGQRPNGFAMMTHSALGWALAGGHRVVPNLPLWDLVVAGTLVWGIATLVALCWPALGSGGLARSAVAIALIASALPLVGGLQFTMSATVAGGAAVALAITELQSAAPRRTLLILAALQLVAGILVRPMAAAAGAIGMSALLAPIAVAGRDGRQSRLSRLAAVMVAVVMMFAALQYADAMLYRIDGRWDACNRYNWMLARLFEWGGEPTAAEIGAMRLSASWSENDWTMLAGWLGVDPDVHSFARVAKAYSAREAQVGWRDQIAALSGRMTAATFARFSRLMFSSAVLLIVVALALGYARPPGVSVAACTVLVFGLFCLVIEVIFKELPFRLLAPLQLCLAAAIVLSLAPRHRTPSPLLGVLTLSVVLAIAADRGVHTVAELQAREAHAEEVDRQVWEFEQLKPSLVVLHADAFPAEVWWRPFQPIPTALRTVPLGDNNQRPQLQDYLTRTGRQPLLRAACDDPSILLISVRGRLEPARVYLREHFGADVDWRQVYAGSFAAWRCERVSASHAADTRTDEALSRRTQ